MGEVRWTDSSYAKAVKLTKWELEHPEETRLKIWKGFFDAMLAQIKEYYGRG